MKKQIPISLSVSVYQFSYQFISYMATGEADPADIEKYIENANNNHFWAVYYSTVSVIAKKSGEVAGD